jgi:staphylococcal nuclease domain-containing protein 1
LHADLLVDRLSDPKQAYYAQEAREFLRKKLIGKHVRVHIDFVRPREGEYEERESASVRVGNQNAWVWRKLCQLEIFSDAFDSNIAEQLIEKGLASVVRHKRDDEDRSPDYDKLMVAEQKFVHGLCAMLYKTHPPPLSVLRRRGGESILERSNRHLNRL